MKNHTIRKQLCLELNKIFTHLPQVRFRIGMSNPKSMSLFTKQINIYTLQEERKKYLKKQNQKKAGREAQQDGENVKNELSVKLSFNGNAPTITYQANALLDFLSIPIHQASFINSKAHSDGKTRCAKSDLKVTIHEKSNSVISHQVSVKSTLKSTQLAAHSVDTFKDYLSNLGIIVPPEVIEFFTHLTYSESSYSSKPQFIFSDSKRRERFAFEEINSFNPLLWIKVQDFFTIHAVLILNFLISIGGDTNPKNFATLLAFCDKKVNNLMFVDIQKFISYLIQESTIHNSFCVLNKPTKHGITTISLFHGFVVLQMKGSGTGATYHSLQFKINGSKIKKLRESNLI